MLYVAVKYSLGLASLFRRLRTPRNVLKYVKEGVGSFVDQKHDCHGVLLLNELFVNFLGVTYLKVIETSQ